MQKNSTQLTVYAAALSDLATGCWFPKIVPLTNAFSGGLDADSKINHAEVMRAQEGNMKICLARQDDWRKGHNISRTTLHAESNLTISEMIVAATHSLRSKIQGSDCIAVNSQNTRDSGYGYATAARMLFEAGCSGPSHTASHRGVTGLYLALEHAILLGTFEKKEKIIVTAGERWLDIYPRLLGNWTCFSDGASALVANLTRRDPATAWVLNATVDLSDFSSSVETGRVSNGEVKQIAHALRTLIVASSLVKGAKVHVLSPGVGKDFCDEVVGKLRKGGDIDVRHDNTSTSYFGSADALIRLNRFQQNWNFEAEQSECCLIWDFEPNGLLGAFLILDAAMPEPAQDLAA